MLLRFMAQMIFETNRQSGRPIVPSSLPARVQKWRSLNECSYTKTSAIQANVEWERVLRQTYHPVWRMEFTLLVGSKKRSPNVNYKEVRTSSKYTKRLRPSKKKKDVSPPEFC